MKKLVLFLNFILFATLIKAQSVFVRFVASKGNITVMLYDETPAHKHMFLEAIKTGAYKNAEFNRVIKAFVSQGGELDDTILNREKRQPKLIPARLPAEIMPALFHKKGALGAGRDDNPDKASYFTQLYFVAGKKQTDAQLDAIEQKTNRKIPEAQRVVYKTTGGTPHLDQDYTVFGEIVEGIEIADAINTVATDKNDVPLAPVVFNLELLSKKEASKLRSKLK